MNQVKILIHKFVVVGGGIAGVCCAQELARLHPKQQIVLITASDNVTESKSAFIWTKHLEEVNVYERTADQFVLDNTNIRFEKGQVVLIDPAARVIQLDDGQHIHFEKLCICSGVKPRLIGHHEHILGVRDLFSIQHLIDRLRLARRVVLVGNGGIALELAHELTFVDLEWVVRESYIGAAFFDATASDFILPALRSRLHHPGLGLASSEVISSSTAAMTERINNSTNHVQGGGAGPSWISKTDFRQQLAAEVASHTGKLMIHLEQEVAHVASSSSIVDRSSDWPCQVTTSIGEVIGCDFVISATGIEPNISFFAESNSLPLDKDGYILVNQRMQCIDSRYPYIFAAGDCCSYPSHDHFFQHRLWTQARVMGSYAAQCMADVEEDYGLDQHLHIFAHITRFFGFKVVLLGQYNAQGLGEGLENVVKKTVLLPDTVNNEANDINDSCDGQRKRRKVWQEDVPTTPGRSSSEYEIWSRVAPNKHFIKLVVRRGRIIGAMLIGDTDMEEVFENLILNQLDVSALGPALLDPDIDLADYFD